MTPRDPTGSADRGPAGGLARRLTRRLRRSMAGRLQRMLAKRRTGVRGRRGRYRVDHHRVEMAEGVFFVPAYATHRPAARRVLDGTLYEPETHRLVAELLARRPGDMIHAGAFFGDMLPTFAAACTGTLYAFEPVLENYVLARLCVEANELDGVVLIHAALGSRTRPARIHTGSPDEPHRGGSSSIADEGQRTTILTIDGLGLNDLSVLQLDVEGHELEALRGAEVTIRRSRPTILVEDNEDACGPFLEGLGYRGAGAVPGLSIWEAPSD